MIKEFSLATAFAALLVLSLGWAAPVAAQEAGDQIVNPEGTPTTSDDDDFTAAQDNTDDTEDDNDTTDDTTNNDDDTTDDNTTNGDNSNQDDDETTPEADDSDDVEVSVDPDDLIVVEDLNLREEASVESDVITVIPAGSTVTLESGLEPENDFVAITFEDESGFGYLPYLVTADREDNLAVITTALNLRSGPTIDDEILTVIPEGAEVRVAPDISTDSDGDDWNHVLYDGTFAWALANYVVYTDDPALTAEADVTSDLATTLDVNLRAGPSLDDEVLSVIPAGTVVLVDGEATDGFVPVTVDGVSGWISLDFLAAVEEIIPTEAVVEEVAPELPATTDTLTRTTLSDLSLRAEPSGDGELLLIIPVDDIVTLTQEGAENGYVTVEYQGVVGWVLAEYLA